MNAIKIREDWKKAFEEHFTEETGKNYMYMYSTDEADFFKHIITRNYVGLKR